MADSQSWWDENFGAGRDVPRTTSETVDLDDETAVQALEDPKLIAHMEYRRNQNRVAEMSMNAVVPHSQIRSQLTLAMDDFAKALLELEDPLISGSTAADEVYVIGSQMLRWGEGRTAEPNFPESLRPADAGERGVLARTTKKTCDTLQKDANKMKQTMSLLTGLRARFAKFRSETARAWESYQKLVESQQESLNANRELLKAAAEVYDYNEKRATKKYAEIRQNLGAKTAPVTPAPPVTPVAPRMLDAVPEEIARAVPEGADVDGNVRDEEKEAQEQAEAFAGRMIPEGILHVTDPYVDDSDGDGPSALDLGLDDSDDDGPSALDLGLDNE